MKIRILVPMCAAGVTVALAVLVAACSESQVALDTEAQPTSNGAVDFAGSDAFEAIMQTAPANQRAALADRHVTRVGTRRRRSGGRLLVWAARSHGVGRGDSLCLSSRVERRWLRSRLDLQGRRPEKGDVAIASPGATMFAKSSTLENSAAIAQAWAVEQTPSDEEREELASSLEDCLATAGAALKGDANLGELVQAAASVGKAGDQCLSDHERLSFGPPPPAAEVPTLENEPDKSSCSSCNPAAEP